MMSIQIQKSRADRTRRERQVIVLEHERLHAALERPCAADLRRFLRLVARDIEKRMIEQGEFATADTLLPRGLWLPKFTDVETPWLMRGVANGAWAEWRLIEQLQAIHDVEQQKFQIPEFFKSIFIALPAAQRDAISGWISTRVVGLWSKVEQTIRNKLAKTLDEGITAGRPIKELTEQIIDIVPDSTPVTARRIARTETTGAMNTGHQQMRVVAAVDEKEWISTRDKLTRSGRFNHRTPDGQKQPNDQPFIVSGERLLYPGDVSLGASGGNVINCRCTSAASVESILKPRPRLAVKSLGKRPPRRK
jgi:hypothetical protein